MLRSSAIRAAAALVSVVASFLTVYALCRHFDAQAGPALLAAILAITQSRRAHPLGWSRELTAPILLAGTALAATGAALLLHAIPWLGAGAFVAALFLSVWLRNFGERARTVGGAIALPFVALLVVPARADAPGGPLVDVALVIAAGLVSLAYATLVALVMRRFGIVTAQTRSDAPASERAKRAGLSIPTRMALQMAVALGLAFVIGFSAFASHWAWTVFTAFIVCSGARGRGDAAYKGALRLIGAAAGTLAAAALDYVAAPSGAAEAALIFIVLFFGLWLRERSYAYWAAAMTLVLALLARSGDTATFALLAVRLEAILIGALCAVAAAWFVYPIRTRDVVRRRLADALVALDGVLTREPRGDDRGTSELAAFESRMIELESVAVPLRWHRRIFAAADVPEHPVHWIDLAHDVKRHARTFIPNHARDARRSGAVRRAIGESRRAIGRHGKGEAEPDAPTVGVALLRLRDLLVDARDSQDAGASAAKRRRMELEAYLHFDGTCEEALTFYKEVFAGEVVSLMRFGEMMGADVPAGHADKVMHASFKSADVKFMASDLRPGATRRAGAQVSLSLSTRDLLEGERLFAMLGVGGEVSMPMHDTFWGARFGTLTDKFGIAWMVNAEKA